MELLVGYSGFVGSNINASHSFDCVFNSKNIIDSYGLRPDLLVYAGVTGTKFYANTNPEEDRKVIKTAIQNIEKIQAKKTILISTVDVYDLLNCDENHIPHNSMFSAYGNNRLFLEKWVSENIKNCLIVRIPALYGINIKKNFVYDLINLIPPMLDQEMFVNINKDIDIKAYYEMGANNFYYFKPDKIKQIAKLREQFKNYKYNSLSYTDSRNEYQYYNLNRLWSDITVALENDIRIINIVTEPIRSDDLYKSVYHKDFKNEKKGSIVKYNIKTKYDTVFGGKNGYVLDKETVMNDLVRYINSNIQARYPSPECVF